jgi:hypothetical protein
MAEGFQSAATLCANGFVVSLYRDDEQSVLHRVLFEATTLVLADDLLNLDFQRYQRFAAFLLVIHGASLAEDQASSVNQLEPSEGWL